MHAANEQIQRIEDKIQQLLKEYNLARKEMLQLQKENDRLQEQLKLQNEEILKLHQKTDALKLYAGGLGSDTKKDLEKRIDTYLKDIDKCLALLYS